MIRLVLLLRLGLAVGLVTVLAGCLDRPVQDAKVEVSGNAITFPAYTIIEGELTTPAQGPYTSFTGNYPEHWPSEWRLDERFFVSGGGAITEKLAGMNGQAVATWEFEGAFKGGADDLADWFTALAAAVNTTVMRIDLDPIFKVINRRSVGLEDQAWTDQGFAGSILISYGPRYGDYTHFVFTVAQRLDDRPVPAESVSK